MELNKIQAIETLQNASCAIQSLQLCKDLYSCTKLNHAVHDSVLCVKAVVAFITRDRFAGLNTFLNVNTGNLKRREKDHHFVVRY